MDLAATIVGFVDSVIDTPEEQENRRLASERIKLEQQQAMNAVKITEANAAAKTQQIMFIAIAVGVIGVGAVAFLALK